MFNIFMASSVDIFPGAERATPEIGLAAASGLLSASTVRYIVIYKSDELVLFSAFL
jgi:hypothetical protein